MSRRAAQEPPLERSLLRRKPGGVAPVLLLLLLLGCSSLRYAGQAVGGGLGVLAKRRQIDAMLADPATRPELREALERVVAIREFAAGELSLPAGRSYRHYRALDRRFAVWNVVAAPELAVEPTVWCFPIAGCVAYRGYFDERRAQAFASKLAAAGMDVDVQGVAAYSTLGWLADPVLSTFIHYPEASLAALLIHELAHRRMYVKGDTALSESFATVVEREGVRRYLEWRGEPRLLESYRVAQRREDDVTALLLATRERLRGVYAAGAADDWKRAEKERLLAELRRSYRDLRAGWGEEVSGWDSWFDDGLDNARLASVAAYHRRLPELEALLASLDGDLRAFYEVVGDLAGSGDRGRG